MFDDKDTEQFENNGENLQDTVSHDVQFYEENPEDISTEDMELHSDSNRNNNYMYETYKIPESVGKKIEKEKRSKKNNFGIRLLSMFPLGIVFGITAFLTLKVSDRLYSTIFPESIESEILEIETAKESIENTEYTNQTIVYAEDVSQVASDVMPAIVAITNKTVQDLQAMFGIPLQQEVENSGSGIIVGKNDTELLIATNNHVVANATTLTVAFIDSNIYEAQIKGTSVENDLAVIAVELTDISNETLAVIEIATLGDSDSLKVGETAIAIGNALGYGQSVTRGIISALDREVVVENITSTLLQTDAAINPGNSGGALLNIKGEVIGINAVKYSKSDVEGMGYAIPISTAKPIISELMLRDTRVKVDEDVKGYLGIEPVTVTSGIAVTYNMPVGVYVRNIVGGGAADNAGIKAGDVITAFDGIPLTTSDGLIDTLKYYEAGETVEVVVQVSQNGGFEEKIIEVTLGSSIR